MTKSKQTKSQLIAENIRLSAMIKTMHPWPADDLARHRKLLNDLSDAGSEVERLRTALSCAETAATDYHECMRQFMVEAKKQEQRADAAEARNRECIALLNHMNEGEEATPGVFKTTRYTSIEWVEVLTAQQNEIERLKSVIAEKTTNLKATEEWAKHLAKELDAVRKTADVKKDETPRDNAVLRFSGWRYKRGLDQFTMQITEPMSYLEAKTYIERTFGPVQSLEGIYG